MSLQILITGASGQVGGELVKTLAGLGDISAPTSAELNLSDEHSIRSMMRATKPHWVVNAGAYTAVDKAESEAQLAHAINAEAPRVLGEEAALLGAAVLHFSTDYVFDGTNAAPYLETDATGPLNVYGASKLVGEQALLASGASALIFRTSWVYGATGKNFLRTILRLAQERESLNIVGDQYGAPTWSRDLANMVTHILSHETLDSVRAKGGIYHAGASGETTWAGFATAIVDGYAVRHPSAKLAAIHAIPSAEYPTPAARPTHSRMSNDKLYAAFGYRMMDWQDSLNAVLSELT